MELKRLKVLHQWPLSKVELVKNSKKKYILKTIHKDFFGEIKRQQILYNKCKKIKIPKIYHIDNGKTTTSFLMDYV